MKILIIQLRRIGDILLTSPVLTYLKTALPTCTIHFLSEPMGKSVLETNPHIDRLIIYDTKEAWKMIQLVRSEKYDVVIDFMNNPRSGFLTLLSGALMKVGWKHPLRKFLYNVAIPVPAEPEYVPLRKLRMTRAWLLRFKYPPPQPTIIRPQLFLTEQDEKVAQDWMSKEKLLPRQFAVIAPASRRELRRWNPENFCEVARMLKEDHAITTYLAWGPGEEAEVADLQKGMEDTIKILPLTSVREMGAIFKRAAFVMSCDSAPTHTAVAVEAPTVTLYGPTRPIDWNPSLAGVGLKNMIVQAPDSDMGKLATSDVIRACKNLLEEKT